MTFADYAAILVKRWKIIALCCLLVGAGTLVGSIFTKSLYQSSVLIQVVVRTSSNSQADYNNLLASDELVQTEATLAVSNSVMRAVASRYPGLTADKLASETTATPRTNTQLFEIDVVDPNPARAATLANDIAATLVTQQAQEGQQTNLQAQQQVQQNIAATNRQIATITAQIAALQYTDSLTTTPADQVQKNTAQIALLQTQLSQLGQQYSQWQTSLAQLQLTQAQNSSPLQIVQSAEPASSPTKPNILFLTGIGLLVGLLLGVLLALLYSQLDTRLRTADEISGFLGWTMLASIWRVKTGKHAQVLSPTKNEANFEAFRILYTNISFASLDKPLRSMMVTSTLPGEGKSSVAANLAIVMASAGKKTLLVDADLRQPVLHSFFDLSPAALGLSNAVLAFQLPGANSSAAQSITLPAAAVIQETPAIPSLEPFVHTVDIPNLWVMPSGPLPPSPAEFLESKVMQRFFTAIQDTAIEMLIFDAPPLLGLSDALSLAARVDGTLVVVDTTRATKGKLKQMKEILSQKGVVVIGCVANKLRLVRGKHPEYAYLYATHQQDSKETLPVAQFIPETPDASLSTKSGM